MTSNYKLIRASEQSQVTGSGKMLFTLFLALLAYTARGQRAGVVYYDTEWKITTKNECAFFRTCIVDTTSLGFYGEVTDYYKNGKIQMRGRYEGNVKVDSFFFYFPSGVLESKGSYKNNQRHGRWTYFHENGEVRQRVEFTDSDFKITELNDSTGKPVLVNGTGVWQNSYQLHNQYMWVRIEGDYKNWKRSGKWKVFTRSGSSEESLEHTDKFQDDALKSPWYSGTFLSAYFPDRFKFQMTEEFKFSVFVSKSNYPFLKHLPDKIDSLKLPYDVSASFPGGNAELDKFLRKNLKYPSLARKERIAKTVSAEFIVDKNGNVTNISAPKYSWDSKNHKYGFQEEVARVIALFPAWIPAKRNGQNVAQKQTIMISFSVNEITIENKYRAAYVNEADLRSQP